MALTDRYVTTGGGGTYAGSTNPGTPMSLSTAFANAVAGDRINIQAGTYTRSASDTLTNAGTAGQPIIYRGYTTTIGDGNLGRTNTNGALITTNMPNIAYNSGFKCTPLGYTIFESINFTGTFTGGALLPLATDDVMKSCKVLNSSATASAVGVGPISTAPNVTLFDCDIEMVGAAGSQAVNMVGIAQRAIGCRIKGGAGTGVNLGGTSAGILIGNVIYANTGIAVAVTNTGARLTAVGNTIVGGGAEAFNFITGLTVTPCLVNNMITDNATYGVEYVSTSNPVFGAYNRYRDNTTANTHNAGDWVTATSYGDITTGNGTTDYVNAASNDYNLVSTSPAVGAGWFRYRTMGALGLPQTSGGSTRIPSIG